jgi:hypothetical protein
MYTADNDVKNIAFLDSNNLVNNIVLFEKETDDITILSFLGQSPQENSTSYVELNNENVIVRIEIGYELFDGYFRPTSPQEGYQWNKDLFMWTTTPSQELLDKAILIDGLVIYDTSINAWTTTPPEDEENYFWNVTLLKWIPKPPDETFSHIWDDESNSWVPRT